MDSMPYACKWDINNHNNHKLYFINNLMFDSQLFLTTEVSIMFYLVGDLQRFHTILFYPKRSITWSAWWAVQVLNGVCVMWCLGWLGGSAKWVYYGPAISARLYMSCFHGDAWFSLYVAISPSWCIAKQWTRIGCLQPIAHICLSDSLSIINQTESNM